MSAALYIWASFTLGWGGTWEVTAGPSVVLSHYSETLNAQRGYVELTPCSVTVDNQLVVELQSRVEASVLAAAKPEAQR